MESGVSVIRIASTPHPSPASRNYCIPGTLDLKCDMATVRLFTTNLTKSINFYGSVLGFVKIEQWGAAFAIVRRGDLDLWLSGPQTSAAKPWEDGTVPIPGGFTRIVLPLPDVIELGELVDKHGGRIANGPLEGPGGVQLIVLDPDGNSIEFFEG